MELYLYKENKPLIIEQDDASAFFNGLWSYILDKKTLGSIIYEPGIVAQVFNEFQADESVPLYQKIATSFLSTYVIANQISLTQIADSFELVTEDLSKSDETILPYEKMISLLTESKESLVFANQNANHSIFYKNGKLMNINEISEKIPSATDIPIKLEGVKSYSTFF